MNVWQAILLGLVQGVTEFLPISSSGHLAVLQSFLGLGSVEEHLFLSLIHISEPTRH